MKNFIHLCFCLSLTLMFNSAFAENLFGEFRRLPDKIERGFFIGADLGVSVLSGKVNGNAPGETATNPGTMLTFTTGYDISKNISLEGLYGFAIHEASPLDQRLEGGVNLFSANLLAKLQYPINRWNPFVSLGAGAVFSDPSFIDGEKYKLSIMGSLGMEYYTMLRHYSLYLRANYQQYDLPVNALSVGFGIKYTF